MVQQMNEVVFNKKAQADRIVVSNSTGDVHRGVWHSADHVRQMMIVENPEIDEFRPRLALIVLRLHPSILLVARKGEFFGLLSSDESLVVIGCRGPQGDQDFFDR